MPVESRCGHAVSITFFLFFFILIVGVLVTYLVKGKLRESDAICSPTCLKTLGQDLCYVAQTCCDSWFNQSLCMSDFEFALNFTKKQMLKAKENWVGCDHDLNKANRTCEKLADILKA